VQARSWAKYEHTGETRPDAETERRLARRWIKRRDRKAFDRLVVSHLPLLVQVARTFLRFGAPFEELVQEGTVGLMEGVRRFDPERGMRLSTYAVYWIRASLYEYVFAFRGMVRQHDIRKSGLFFRLRKERAKLEAQYGEGHPAIDEALARKFNKTVEEIRNATARMSPDVSFDEPAWSEGETSRIEATPGSTEPLDERAGRDELDARVREVIARVATKPRDAIILEELLMGDGDVSRAQVGRKIGLSRERVRQLELDVRARLEEPLRAAVGE
jgi:RNA polymerase sigma-32 factor